MITTENIKPRKLLGGQILSEEIDTLILKVAKEMKAVSLQALVDKLEKDYGIKPLEATKRIHLLWKNKNIDIVDVSRPSTFFNYLFSIKSLWFWVLNLIVSASLLMTLISWSSFLYLRYILGSIYVLYLPGCVLIEALYPREDDLDAITRLALSIISSLSIVALVAFLLNYTPFKISLTPITISLAIITETVAIFVLIRKYRISTSATTEHDERK